MSVHRFGTNGLSERLAPTGSPSIHPLTCVECGGTGWVWGERPTDYAMTCESCNGEGLEPLSADTAHQGGSDA